MPHAQPSPRTDRPSGGVGASNVVDAYALSVVSGLVPAGKYHRLACQRHLDDRKRENTEGFPYVFQIEQADRFFRFAYQLKHYKGKQFAGKPIELTPVQKFRLGSIFGWRHVDTGLRRFTTAYNELPRKSGKTLEAAVVALYVTFFEGEPGAEGYCIATKRQQAKLVWDACKQLVKSSGLRGRVSVMAHNLHREATQQKLEPLGADADSTDGLNPYLIITDEFHAMKNRGLIDVMESATGARLSFLHFQITTAGKDPVSPCGDQHDYACKILDRAIVDEATECFFVFIAHADLEDDWLDELTWQKANPQWGISVNPDDLRKLALKAKNMPSAAAEFKQKRLNLWVNSDQPWLSVDGWRNGQGKWVPSDLKGLPCWVGVDLASKIDIAAAVAVFPPTVDCKSWRWVAKLYTPKETLEERARRDRAPYQVWVDQGWLIAVPGVRIDQDAIRDGIAEFDELYDLHEIGYDPWNAGNFPTDLQGDDFKEEQVIEVPQTMAHMSAPSKELEAVVLEEKLDAGGNPALLWMASNVVVQKDGKDNIFPVKKKSRGRIDGIVAGVIGMKLSMTSEPTTSVYETRGLSSI